MIIDLYEGRLTTAPASQLALGGELFTNALEAHPDVDVLTPEAPTHKSAPRPKPRRADHPLDAGASLSA